MFKNINVWGLAAATLFSWLFGFVWYAVLFEQQWLSLTGLTSESGKGEEWRMILGVVQLIVVGVGLDWLRRTTHTEGYMPGLKMGLWVALFFTVTNIWMRYIYELAPIQLIGIDAAYVLITIGVSAALICGFHGFKKAVA